MWFRKTESISDSVLKRVTDLEIRLRKAESEILGLATDNEIIRNKVLRKIQFKKTEETSEESIPQTNNPLFIPS